MTLLHLIYNDTINNISDIDIKLNILSFMDTDDKRSIGYTSKQWMTILEEYYRRIVRYKRYLKRLAYSAPHKTYLTLKDPKKIVLNRLSYNDDLLNYINKTVLLRRKEAEDIIGLYINTCKRERLTAIYTIDDVIEYDKYKYCRTYSYFDATLALYSESINNNVVYMYHLSIDGDDINTYFNNDETITKIYKNNELFYTRKERDIFTEITTLLTLFDRKKKKIVSLITKLDGVEEEIKNTYYDDILISQDFSQQDEKNRTVTINTIWRSDGTIQSVMERRNDIIISVYDSKNDMEDSDYRKFEISTDIITSKFTFTKFDSQGNFMKKLDLLNNVDMKQFHHDEDYDDDYDEDYSDNTQDD